MSSARGHTWQEIQERIRCNIRNRVWSPGDLIPTEADLAKEFGCARTTVNRALRELASTGVIDRKRKAGTRVIKQNTRRVTAEIPVIRSQVESQGATYRFSLLKRAQEDPSAKIRNAMRIGSGCKALHLKSIHFANEEPYIYEDRWINLQTLPEISEVDLAKVSANEWLVQHVPFTNGDFIVSASPATKSVANALQLSRGDSLLCSTRSTWLESESVTRVNLYYSPGYQMRFEI